MFDNIDWGDIFFKIIMGLLVLLVLFLIAYGVDQGLASNVTTYPAMTVVDKNSGVIIVYNKVGNVSVPTIIYYYRLYFRLKSQLISGDVSSACYYKTQIGDEMDLQYKRASFQKAFTRSVLDVRARTRS